MGEQGENLPLARAQVHVGRRSPVPVSVPCRRSATSQRTTNPGEQLAGIHGLRDVVVGSEHQAGDPVECARAIAGDQDHGQVVAETLMQRAEELQSVRRARQVDLDDGECRAMAVEPLEKQLGVLSRADLATQLHGDLYHRRARRVVVVDHQDLAAVTHRSPPSCPKRILL